MRYYHRPKPKPKHNTVKLTLLFLLVGIMVIIIMTLDKVSDINIQSGGGWGIFSVLGKLFGSVIYLIWYIVIVGVLHTAVTLIGREFIKDEKKEAIIFIPLYLIIIGFYMVYVHNQIYDVPKYDLATAEGRLGSEEEFIAPYEKTLSTEKLQPRLPSRETVINDNKKILAEIRNIADQYLQTKDSLAKDSLAKIIATTYGVNYHGMDDALIRMYLKELVDSTQTELITYSSNLNYFMGLLTFSFHDEQNRPEVAPYSTTLFIGHKTDSTVTLYFYPALGSTKFFLRKNARTYTLAQLYNNELSMVIPSYVHDSPLSSEFWNSEFFAGMQYKEKTYQRYQIDTSYFDTINHYAPRPYARMKK